MSVTWQCLPGYPIRLALATVLVGTFTYGLAENFQPLPYRPTILAEAAHFVQQHSRPGNVVVVEDACEVNLFGYYLARSGVEGVTVRTTQLPGQTDRLHYGSCRLSVRPSDFAPGGERLPQRYWAASYADLSAPLRDASRKVIVGRTFEDERGGRFEVVLFERPR